MSSETVVLVLAALSGVYGFASLVYILRRDTKRHVQEYNDRALAAHDAANAMLSASYPAKEIAVTYTYREGFSVHVDGQLVSGYFWEPGEAIEDAVTRARFFPVHPTSTVNPASEQLEPAGTREADRLVFKEN